MKKIILALMLSFLIVPFISADANNDLRLRIAINNNTINAKLYAPLTVFGSTQVGEVFSITETMPINMQCASLNYTVIDGNWSYPNHTETYNPIGNYGINYLFDRVIFSGVFNSTGGSNASVSEAILSNIITQLNNSLKDYNTCLTEKATIWGNYRSLSEISVIQNDSYNNYKKCSSEIIVCNDEKSKFKSDYENLVKTQDSKQQEKYIWGVIGIAIGAGVMAYFTGKLGGPKVRSPDDSYNRQQAG